MGKERYTYLDTAKAYLILLVIMGHVLIVLNPDYSNLHFRIIQEYIYVFHMPAFYIIHGVLFNNEKWKKIALKRFVAKRLYSMMVPYLFFEAIGIVWRAIFQRQSITTGLFNMLTIRCNVGADWFLPAMFLGSMLFLIYIKHPNLLYGVISMIICFILPMFMSGHQILIILGRGLLAYGFIMIGNLARTLFVSERIKNLWWLCIAVLIVGIVTVLNIKFGGNDFYACAIHNPITLVVGGVSGTLLIISLSRNLQCKMLSTIGKYTLIIMGTHQLVIYGLSALVPELYGGGIIKGVLLSTAIVIFEIPVVYLMNRYLPFFVGMCALPEKTDRKSSE